MTLEDWLHNSGESMTALAQRCGVHPATVLRWKNGERRPRPRQMAALTRATQGHVRAQDFQIDAHAGTPYWINPLAEAGPSEAPGLAETQAPFGAEAQALGLDAAAIAAQAVQDAIRAEKARRWLAENEDAIEAWNRWTESNELPLAEYRMF
ncbi:MAG: type II toxin-antitoxin system CcdA family antitoxin [Roseococcus sp.]|nr:type II toxin-antitoxin system CcdA family antitoxin [Roseococcus sp.]